MLSAITINTYGLFIFKQFRLGKNFDYPRYFKMDEQQAKDQLTTKTQTLIENNQVISMLKITLIWLTTLLINVPHNK